MRILETASYVPARVVTNDELSQLMDTSDEWITTRTGIKQRHISQGETTSDLAVNVANQLLANVTRQLHPVNGGNCPGTNWGNQGGGL